ncbi:uncharacterized protein [Montipora foliosa]|uniref:uncharacterized protein n=1 Tax=Montipora foliosa TaxID=591990 RepID=UPI0035F112E9
MRGELLCCYWVTRSLKGHLEEKGDIRRQVAWLSRIPYNRLTRSLKGHPEEEEKGIRPEMAWLARMRFDWLIWNLEGHPEEEKVHIRREMAWLARMRYDWLIWSLEGHPEEEEEDIRPEMAWLARMRDHWLIFSLQKHPEKEDEEKDFWLLTLRREGVRYYWPIWSLEGYPDERKSDIRPEMAWLARIRYNRLMRSLKGHPEEKEDIRRQVVWLARMFLAFSRKNSHLFLENEFRVSFICVSPRQKWLLLIYPDEPDILRVYSVSETNEEQYFLDADCILRDLGEPFVYFTFTNDDSYFIYSTFSGSLHALCLETGTALQNVSGTNLSCFKGERQVGYSFQSKLEKKAIYLTNLFSPLVFLPLSRSFSGSAVSKSTAMTFISSNRLKSISSDSLITSWQVLNEGVSLTSYASLESSRALQNVVFSANGKSIAFRDENKVKLGSVSAELAKVQDCCTIFDQASSSTAVVSFSTNSQYLLVCIRDELNVQDFYVWDVEKQELSVKFKLPGRGIFECFCLSSDKTKVILCCKYEIDIWKYCNDFCCLLERIVVEIFYSSVKFSQCIVSLDNELLVCCIANIIILYSLRVPGKIFESKRIFRGHLGRIESCKFLKINRYLISYGIDGVVFLWDLEKTKAVGFAKITQNQESIVGMAVSPEEDRAVCFTSCGRICVIKLCDLGLCPSLKLLTAPTKHETNTEERPQPAEEIVCTISASCTEDEVEFSSSESEEDMLAYYLEHDDIDEFD